ncbi:uncharacterized protein FOMMEDRAFT_159143 [Fomitiporia mediterranea MF3/22]|uniref:uncharacterized protein n=1 Tax=Fomitiporia mediterranea (strain MF3/22) TaxID=694068 RepID=UPI0004407644|nr:uncharacterized protein FOMMEDRAFT_159143 [Fomitiporia mediterranea MF3/22]EJD00453.1 hypothetical protein FOMMEDRAFT_159143 [Fomitiporia mediterranea MF3/22]
MSSLSPNCYLLMATISGSFALNLSVDTFQFMTPLFGFLRGLGYSDEQASSVAFSNSNGSARETRKKDEGFELFGFLSGSSEYSVPSVPTYIGNLLARRIYRSSDADHDIVLILRGVAICTIYGSSRVIKVLSTILVRDPGPLAPLLFARIVADLKTNYGCVHVELLLPTCPCTLFLFLLAVFQPCPYHPRLQTSLSHDVLPGLGHGALAVLSQT